MRLTSRLVHMMQGPVSALRCAALVLFTIHNFEHCVAYPSNAELRPILTPPISIYAEPRASSSAPGVLLPPTGSNLLPVGGGAWRRG